MSLPSRSQVSVTICLILLDWKVFAWCFTYRCYQLLTTLCFQSSSVHHILSAKNMELGALVLRDQKDWTLVPFSGQMGTKEYQNTVTTIHFHYILVDALANEIIRLAKFKDLSSITFIQNQWLRRTKETMNRMEDEHIQRPSRLEVWWVFPSKSPSKSYNCQCLLRHSIQLLVIMRSARPDDLRIRNPRELEPFRKLSRLRTVAIKEQMWPGLQFDVRHNTWILYLNM